MARATILKSLEDVEPDLELKAWNPPSLRSESSADTGPKCPVCGHPLTFESYYRIRPPPLESRGRIQAPASVRFETHQN